MWQYGHTPHQALALNNSDVNTLKHKWVIKKHKLQPLFWAFLPRNKPVQIEKKSATFISFWYEWLHKTGPETCVSDMMNGFIERYIHGEWERYLDV